ncbi:hypothetical protein ANANG_G00300770 [Anguilla anguilla]|uniref:CEP170 C-terminal domain-containing protein n=1 Tax=Anguilla anguilla TaxID=7936 RepID=A0A9D3RIH3_ANGAN|nr:hypothetical protein ANANG_G00300770 [Anguilla anguilla]
MWTGRRATQRTGRGSAWAGSQRWRSGCRRAQVGWGRAWPGAGRGGPCQQEGLHDRVFDEANPRKRRSYSFSQTAPLLGEGPGPTPPPAAPRRLRHGRGLRRCGLRPGRRRPHRLPPAPQAEVRRPLRVRTGPHQRGAAGGPADLPKSAPRPPVEKEHEDDHSDKGTYTIELEKPSHEEEEARRMIDKVFGVEGNRDSARTGRPEHLQEGAEAKPPGCSATEILPEDLVALGSSSWVSQWASLAANHTRTDPEGSGGEATALVLEKDADVSGSGQSAVCSSGHTERRRRALPQLPGEERPQLGRGPCSIGEKQDTEPQEKDPASRPGHRGRRRRGDRGDAGEADPRAAVQAPAWEKRGGGGEEAPATRGAAWTPWPCSGTPRPSWPSWRPGCGDEGEPTPGPADRPLPPRTPRRARRRGTPSARAPKRRTLSSLHKEKSAATPSSTAREHLERRARPRPPRAGSPVTPPTRPPLPPASLDLTDDDPASSLPHSAFSSDQETGSARSHGRGQLTSSSARVPLSKPESGSALRPRPTRTSLLRRARLGEASDTDLADADRASVASEPRRTRPGSLSARSDSEATLARGSAPPASPPRPPCAWGSAPARRRDAKPPARLRANSVTKLPDAKAKPASSAHSASAAPGRWRRLPPEYASTSEDEFGSNRNAPKPGRLRPGSALRGARLGGSTPALPGSPGGVALRHHRMRDQEEYIRDWTSHSEEIARISQDLAKDLAILAREIHDVAGEIDSVGSSGTAPSTTVSTAATTPGSAIDTREELVDRVFDESLNFRKIPPIVLTKAPEINGRPAELRLHPRRPRSPDRLAPPNLEPGGGCVGQFAADVSFPALCKNPPIYGQNSGQNKDIV